MKNLSKKSSLLSLLAAISFQVCAEGTNVIKASEIRSLPHNGGNYYSVTCLNGVQSSFYQPNAGSCTYYSNGRQTYQTPEACSLGLTASPELVEILNKEIGDLFCKLPNPYIKSDQLRGDGNDGFGDEFYDVTCTGGKGRTFWGNGYYRLEESRAELGTPFCQGLIEAAALQPIVVELLNLTWMPASEIPFSYEQAQVFCNDRLNENAPPGTAKWRLPTADEVGSLSTVLYNLHKQDPTTAKLTKFGLKTAWSGVWAQPNKGNTTYKNYVSYLENNGYQACYDGKSQQSEECYGGHQALCVKDNGKDKTNP